MCGILGFINIGNKNILSHCLNEIKHRGPDDYGIVWFDEDNSGFGHRRLSIIDLSSAGHQPMSNGRYWITYNGEIYNYKEIRNELMNLGYFFLSNTDTEVILNAFQEWGVDCLNKFNGMFSFAIWDTIEKELFVARDRIGIKPFYYWENNGQLIFSSEIKAIIKSKLIPVYPDIEHIINPTRYQISPYTGFKDIYKLEPGHFFLYKNGRLVKKSYWDIIPTENENSKEYLLEKLDFLLNDSVKLQMLSDVPIGVFLSGGLDSSIISALASKNTEKQLNSFTIKFSKKDQRFEKMPDDSFYARIIAEKFNFKHNEIEINPDIISLLPKITYQLDEPLADPAAINTYLIAKTARDMGIVVLLNGMGGDEIFGGYRKYLASILAEKYNKVIPLFFRKNINNCIKNMPESLSKRGFRYVRWLKRFISLTIENSYDRYLSSDLSMSSLIFNKLYSKDYFETYYYKSLRKYFNNNLSYLTQMCLCDTKVFLPEHNLNYSDKAAMLASVESRPPLTDHRIVELMFTVKPKFRINRNIQKYLLKKVSEKYIPKNIIYRPKAPFGSPLRSWIKNDLKELVNDLLLSDSIRNRGIYNYDYIKKIIMSDREGKADYSAIIWQLLTTEIWFKEFFEK